MTRSRSSTIVAIGALMLLVFARGALRSPAQVGGITLNVRDFGAVLNGVTNDAPAVQAAINALPASGGTLIIPGQAAISGSILLEGKRNFIIEGRGAQAGFIQLSSSARLLRGYYGFPALLIVSNSATGAIRSLTIDSNNRSVGAIGIADSHHIEVSDMTIKNIGGEGIHGIIAVGNSFNRYLNNTITNVGVGIHAGGNNTVEAETGALISGNEISQLRGDGIVVSAMQATIEDNIVSDSPYSSIVIGGTIGYRTFGTVVRRNTVLGTGWHGIQCDQVAWLPPIDDVLVAENTIENAQKSGIYVARGTHWIVQENTISNSTVNGISVIDAAHVVVANNTISGSQSDGISVVAYHEFQAGVLQSDFVADDITVEHNSIADGGGNGIHVAAVDTDLSAEPHATIDGLRIEGNTVQGHPSYGILITAESPARFSNVRVVENAFERNDQDIRNDAFSVSATQLVSANYVPASGIASLVFPQLTSAAYHEYRIALNSQFSPIALRGSGTTAPISVRIPVPAQYYVQVRGCWSPWGALECSSWSEPYEISAVQPAQPISISVPRARYNVGKGETLRFQLTVTANSAGITLDAPQLEEFAPAARISPRPSSIAVHAWQEASHENINAVIRVERRQPVTAAATYAIRELAQKTPGNRVIQFWGDLEGAFDRADLVRLMAEGPFVDTHIAWYAEFYRRLKDAGAEIDRIVLDNEEGMSVWNFFSGIPNGEARVAIMRPLFASEAVQQRMPAGVRRWSADNFANPTTGRQAYIDWNAWAKELKNDALKGSIVDTAASVFGRQIPVSNYSDIFASDPLTDLNGWPLSSGGIGEWSSPSLYLFPGGGKYAQYLKDPRWNRFIDNLNNVRSAMKSSHPMIPWVSFPSYNGDYRPATSPWLWQQMVRHMVANGVSQFLYWNPQPTNTFAVPDDAIASMLWSELSNQEIVQRNLSQVPFDADSVTTGNVTTRYSDFLASLPASQSAPRAVFNFEWTPPSDAPLGEHRVTFHAYDEEGNTTSNTVTITVEDEGTNHPAAVSIDDYVTDLSGNFGTGYTVSASPLGTHSSSYEVTVAARRLMPAGRLHLLTFEVRTSGNQLTIREDTMSIVFGSGLLVLPLRATGSLLYEGLSNMPNIDPMRALGILEVRSATDSEVHFFAHGVHWRIYRDGQQAKSEQVQFILSEDLIYRDKPDLTSLGIEHVKSGSNFFSDWGTTCSQTIQVCIPDEAKTRNWARGVTERIAYIDDVLTLSTTDEAHNTEVKEKLTRILGWIKSERPDLTAAMYAFLPHRQYYASVDYMDSLRQPGSAWHVANLPRFKQAFEDWKAKNTALMEFSQHVDVIFPSIYTFTHNDPNWELYAYANMLEARRYGKPVYAFIWPQRHPGNGPVDAQPYLSGQLWKRQLEFIREYADGVVLWGYDRYIPDDHWDENKEWWMETKAFVEKYRTSFQDFETQLQGSADASGVISLSWDTMTGATIYEVQEVDERERVLLSEWSTLPSIQFAAQRNGTHRFRARGWNAEQEALGAPSKFSAVHALDVRMPERPRDDDRDAVSSSGGGEVSHGGRRGSGTSNRIPNASLHGAAPERSVSSKKSTPATSSEKKVRPSRRARPIRKLRMRARSSSSTAPQSYLLPQFLPSSLAAWVKGGD